MSNASDSVSIIQITDTHLYADGQSEFGGIVTEDSLKQVLDLAQNSEQWPPDMVLVTGDLVQQPVKESYVRLNSILLSLDVPVYCLPGNHDNPQMMQQYLNQDNVSTQKIIETNEWCVLLLNSFKPGTHSGELPEEELRFMQQSLKQYQHKHILIALHHHPVSIYSTWMDSMILDNADDFLDILSNHTNVRAVIWGHIHQAFHEIRNGVEFIGSPSTCAQFTPGADAYSRDSLKAGYRYLKLNHKGTITTSVYRIS